MDLEAKKHKAVVREATARRVRSYHEGRPGESVTPMIDLAVPRKSDRMLDIGCGAGLVALAFAPLVKHVVGVDITEEMIELARKRAAELGVSNADFIVDDAERLRFGQGLFDLVTCRSTFHQLMHAEKALHEMARVLTREGRIVIYDLEASDDSGKAARHNEIMAMRDPSHVRVRSAAEWNDFVRECGLHIEGRVCVMMKREFADWMDMVDADAERRGKVRAALMATAQGDQAGLGVRVSGDSITFSQTCGIWLLKK